MKKLLSLSAAVLALGVTSAMAQTSNEAYVQQTGVGHQAVSHQSSGAGGPGQNQSIQYQTGLNNAASNMQLGRFNKSAQVQNGNNNNASRSNLAGGWFSAPNPNPGITLDNVNLSWSSAFPNYSAGASVSADPVSSAGIGGTEDIGLGIYQSGNSNEAFQHQLGNSNMAGISQNGNSNYAKQEQTSNNNQSGIYQADDSNTAYTMQAGSGGHKARIVQTNGIEAAAATNNKAHITQLHSSHIAVIEQRGVNLTAKVYQNW